MLSRSKNLKYTAPQLHFYRRDRVEQTGRWSEQLVQLNMFNPRIKTSRDVSSARVPLEVKVIQEPGTRAHILQRTRRRVDVTSVATCAN
jgi:hypothetical protein